MPEFDNNETVDDCFQAHDTVMERWLKDDVAPAYDACKAGTNKTSSLDDMRKRIELFMAAKYKN